MKNKDIDIIVDKIKKSRSILGIAIVGSYNKEKEYNDIDFLILCRNIKVTKKYLTNIFKDYNIYFNDDSIKITDYLKCEISFGMYELKDLKKKINNYINGKKIEPIYKNWNIVGWLPECLLCDLSNMNILYERRKNLTKIKNNIIIYPKKLQDAIINLCDDKINNLEKIKTNDILENKIIDSELLSLRIRKNIALKGKYFKGYKRISKTLKEMEVNVDE